MNEYLLNQTLISLIAALMVNLFYPFSDDWLRKLLKRNNSSNHSASDSEAKGDNDKQNTGGSKPNTLVLPEFEQFAPDEPKRRC